MAGNNQRRMPTLDFDPRELVDPLLVPLAPPSLVAGFIRAAVEAGTIRPGDVLVSYPAMAAKFGVSYTTVYEAVQTLKREGLIRVGAVGTRGGSRRMIVAER